MSRETWKDVKGYETACRVSDMGSYMKLNPQSGVWNLHRNQDKMEERLVKLRTMEGGARSVRSWAGSSLRPSRRMTDGSEMSGQS